jgi:hypothetical protein
LQTTRHHHIGHPTRPQAPNSYHFVRQFVVARHIPEQLLAACTRQMPTHDAAWLFDWLSHVLPMEATTNLRRMLLPPLRRLT